MGIQQVVRVRRDALEACMTCPICHKLFKDATTISLCLHTFCRKCIYEKLSDEDVDSCPVCNIDLGCLPVEKLRPDHSLQDIRAKIFPFKRRKTADPPEVPPSISPPVKRKERSLSSLAVSTPKVWMQTGLTGKRTKAVARKASALKGCSFSIGDPIKKEDDSEDDRLDSPVADPFNEQRPNKNTQKDAELTEGKVDLWTPLNCLVEAANRTKSSKFNSQGQSLAKLESLNGPGDERYMSGAKSRAKGKTESPTASGEMNVLKNKTKENGHKTRIVDETSGKLLAAVPVKRRRVHPAGRKIDASEEVHRVDAYGAKCYGRNGPIWFSLVASEDQKGDVSLPQISACYLRIKDGTVPVSYIQKYLAKKLELTSETEVEIMCRGHPVLPSLQLHNLVDLWFRTASKKVPTSVGSSAKDFVMVLSYCRKVQVAP